MRRRTLGRSTRSDIRDPTTVLHGAIGSEAHELVHDLRSTRIVAIVAAYVQSERMASWIALTLFGNLRCTIVNIAAAAVATINLPAVT